MSFGNKSLKGDKVLIGWTYNENGKQLESWTVEQEDRTVNVHCSKNIHEFPPNAAECVCGKFDDLKKLRQPQNPSNQTDPSMTQFVHPRTGKEIARDMEEMRKKSHVESKPNH